jgi:hypothetical protein
VVCHFVICLLCILVSVFMRVLTKNLYRMIQRTEEDVDFLYVSWNLFFPPPHLNCWIIYCKEELLHVELSLFSLL